MTQKTANEKKPRQDKKAASSHGSKRSRIIASNERLIVDIAKEIVSTAGNANLSKNEFCQMKLEIASRIAEYDRIRRECDITDPAHSATIYGLAKPFLEGCFTLAIVGKTSAGKSTFINTLIGDNIFPTGHFQTTSAITYIERGDTVKLEVLFCDGRKETIPGDVAAIKAKLKELVAIPEEYSRLPINDINRLISANCDVTSILKRKTGIENKTKCARVDDKLWERYVMSHPKKDIAKEVHIYCPLPLDFEGWRIIDTPGIGARGGIQDATKKLFDAKDEEDNNLVDAIVFLHSGTDNIEDDKAYDFMEMIVKGLTEEAKKRLLFVITKSSIDVFRLNKDKTLQIAGDLYTKNFGIPKERITYIDSLLERFNKEVQDKKNFNKMPCPSNWNEEEWEIMTNLFTAIEKEITNNGEEMTNESIEKVMKRWANFDHLKLLLDNFLREEKAAAYDNICKYIEEDCLGFIKDLGNQKKLLLGGKEEIHKEQNRLQQKKIEYNELLNRLKREASMDIIWPQFDFIDKTLCKFSSIENIELVETAYRQLINDAEKKEKEIIENIKKEFKKYITNDANDSYARLEMIDLDALEKQAREETPKIKIPSKKKSVIGRLLDRIKNLFSSNKEIVRSYPTEKDDTEKIRQNYIERVIKEARKQKKDFKSELKSIIDNYCNLIGKQLNSRYQDAEDQLQELKGQLIDKDNRIAVLDEKLIILANRKR